MSAEVDPSPLPGGLGWLGRTGSVALLFLVSTAAILLTTRAAWMHPTTTVIGGSSDGIQKAWFLSWFAFAVTHKLDPLVTSYLSIPGHPIDLMRNTAVPLWGLLMFPVTILGGAVLSLNLAMMISLVAGPVVTCLVFQRYVKLWPAAWAGGFIFGLCPFAFAEADLGHLTWVSLWFIPLTLLMLDEILVRQRKNATVLGLVLGLLFSCELLINQELLATTITTVTLLLALVAIYYRGRIISHLGYALRALCAGVIVWVVICAFPVWSEFFGPGHLVHGANLKPLYFSADLLGFMLPTAHQLLSPSWATAISTNFTGDTADTTVYLGVPLLAAIVFGWVRYRSDPWFRWSAVLTVLAMVLSLGSQLHVAGHVLQIPLPWSVLARLPVLGLVLPSRIVVFALFGGSLCLAIVLDRLWAESGVPARLGAAAFLCSAAIVFIPSSSLYVQHLSVPTFFTKTSHTTLTRGDYAAVLPVPTGGNLAVAMLWQFSSGFQYKLPWSYAIQAGPGRRALVSTPSNPVMDILESVSAGESPSEHIGPTLVRVLEGWQVRTLLVGPMAAQTHVVDWLSKALGERPTWYGSVALWRVGASNAATAAGHTAVMTAVVSAATDPLSAAKPACTCTRYAGQGGMPSEESERVERFWG